jgi:hypothetical protein
MLGNQRRHFFGVGGNHEMRGAVDGGMSRSSDGLADERISTLHCFRTRPTSNDENGYRYCSQQAVILASRLAVTLFCVPLFRPPDLGNPLGLGISIGFLI